MAIGKGSKVKKGEQYGHVISIAGENVNWQLANGGRQTDTAESLTEVTDGWKGSFAKQQPDLMELGANVAVFAGTQVARKRKALGEATMRFAASDFLYEFVLKTWFQTNVESKISETARDVLTGSDADNPSSQDVMDALLKTVSIGSLDIVYKLVRTRKVTMSTAYYLLQAAASFYIANLMQRQFRPKDLGYRPQ